MTSHPYRSFLPYGVAIVSTGIALLLSLWIQQVLPQTIGAFFYIAIAITAWFGGAKPGISSIILALLALDYYFIPPLDQIWILKLEDILWLALFVMVSLVITLLSSHLRQSKQRIEQLNRKLIDESSDRLRIALNAAQMGMWNWNIVTGEINWSPEHEQLFGLPSGSFDGRYETFSACLHPNDQEGLNQVLSRSLQDRLPYHHEFRVVWADGSTHWIEGRGQALYDTEGQPVQMSGTIMAIDQRKQTEVTLQEQESLLRLFVQYAPAGIAMLDRELRYVMASQRWVDEHYLDSVESLIGRSHYEIFPEVPEQWRQIHQRCLAGAIEKCDDDLFVRADGTQQWMSWEIRPWYTATDDIGGIIIFAVDVTHRKQAEQALRQSEARLRLAQLASNSAVWDWDIPSNTLTWSPEYYQLYELDPSIEASYDNWLRCIHPDDREQTSQQTAQVLKDQSSELRVEFRVIRRDKIRWFAGIGQVLWAANEPIRMIGITIDITAQKMAEIALQEFNTELEQRVAERTAELTIVNDRLLETLMEQQHTQLLLFEQAQLLDLAHDTIMTCDLNSVITLWNQGAERTYGWAKSEALGQDSHVLLKTQLPQPLAEIQAILAEQGYWEGELVHFDRDDRPLTVASRWVLQKDQMGRPIKILEINNDITARKQAEQALQQYTLEVEDLYNNAPCGYHSLNSEGTLIRINDTELNWLGYTREEVLYKKKFVDLMTPESQHIFYESFLQVKQQGWLNDLEFQMLNKDGTTRWVSLSSTTIKDEAGNFVMSRSTLFDISERRKIDQMKRDFISVVSHELRTPLTSIRGSLGLVAGGVYDQKPEKRKEMIAIAARQSDRLVRLVNDILDLRRLESGQTRLSFKPCSALDLIQQSVDVMRSQAEQNQLTLTVIPTDAAAWVDADAIVQTLTNLISNAIKFSPPGSTITLTASPYLHASAPLPGTPFVLFSIQDQGRGIPADQLETIFGQFQQVDASDSREKGGTGLGLAICRTIVEHHHGKIWVESTLGQGSTFYMMLPSVPSSQISQKGD